MMMKSIEKSRTTTLRWMRSGDGLQEQMPRIWSCAFTFKNYSKNKASTGYMYLERELGWEKKTTTT